MTAALRYRRSDLLFDYGRAALGTGLSGAVLAAPTTPAVTVAAAGLATLFGVFALRTAARQITRYELSTTGIAELGWRTVVLDWSKLDGVKVRYYAPRRKRTKGWMALSLRAGRRRLSLDSTLPEFEQVAALALAAARRNSLELDEITVGNLAALDLPPPVAERS
ncbi:MAG TPA: hypothetical protein VED46_10470 [Alphaproteobacteria bacterium]|nr:hypothetical protein [Alphaproteobacteria bacterium]